MCGTQADAEHATMFLTDLSPDTVAPVASPASLQQLVAPGHSSAGVPLAPPQLLLPSLLQPHMRQDSNDVTIPAGSGDAAAPAAAQASSRRKVQRSTTWPRQRMMEANCEMGSQQQQQQQNDSQDPAVNGTDHALQQPPAAAAAAAVSPMHSSGLPVAATSVTAAAAAAAPKSGAALPATTTSSTGSGGRVRLRGAVKRQASAITGRELLRGGVTFADDVMEFPTANAAAGSKQLTGRRRSWDSGNDMHSSAAAGAAAAQLAAAAAEVLRERESAAAAAAATGDTAAAASGTVDIHRRMVKRRASAPHLGYKGSMSPAAAASSASPSAAAAGSGVPMPAPLMYGGMQQQHPPECQCTQCLRARTEALCRLLQQQQQQQHIMQQAAHHSQQQQMFGMPGVLPQEGSGVSVRPGVWRQGSATTSQGSAGQLPGVWRQGSGNSQGSAGQLPGLPLPPPGRAVSWASQQAAVSTSDLLPVLLQGQQMSPQQQQWFGAPHGMQQTGGFHSNAPAAAAGGQYSYPNMSSSSSFGGALPGHSNSYTYQQQQQLMHTPAMMQSGRRSLDSDSSPGSVDMLSPPGVAGALAAANGLITPAASAAQVANGQLLRTITPTGLQESLDMLHLSGPPAAAASTQGLPYQQQQQQVMATGLAQQSGSGSSYQQQQQMMLQLPPGMSPALQQRLQQRLQMRLQQRAVLQQQQQQQRQQPLSEAAVTVLAAAKHNPEQVLTLLLHKVQNMNLTPAQLEKLKRVVQFKQQLVASKAALAAMSSATQASDQAAAAAAAARSGSPGMPVAVSSSAAVAVVPFGAPTSSMLQQQQQEQQQQGVQGYVQACQPVGGDDAWLDVELQQMLTLAQAEAAQQQQQQQQPWGGGSSSSATAATAAPLINGSSVQQQQQQQQGGVSEPGSFKGLADTVLQGFDASNPPVAAAAGASSAAADDDGLAGLLDLPGLSDLPDLPDLTDPNLSSFTDLQDDLLVGLVDELVAADETYQSVQADFNSRQQRVQQLQLYEQQVAQFKQQQQQRQQQQQEQKGDETLEVERDAFGSWTACADVSAAAWGSGGLPAAPAATLDAAMEF